MVNLAKKGIVTAYKDGYLYYVDAKDSALSGGNGLDMTTNQTSNTTHRSRGIYIDIQNIRWFQRSETHLIETMIQLMQIERHFIDE